MIKNDTQAILEFIHRNTDGFISLAESFIDQQHETIKSTKEIVHRLEDSYNHTKNYDKKIVHEDIPNLHEFKIQLQGLLYLIKSTFQDNVQKVATRDVLFGLSSKEYYSKYEDIFPKEFTKELQTKIGLYYDNNQKTSDEDKEENNVQIVKFHNPFNLPFDVERSHQKSIESLGYSDIHELKKLSKSIFHCVLSLTHDLPEYIDTVKSSNNYTKEILSQKDKELTEDGPDRVITSVSVWSSLTESCLRAITFYTRAYQEILNRLLNSVYKNN